MAEYGKKPVLRAVRGLGFCSRFAFPQQISLLFFGLFMRGNIMKDGHCPMNGAMLVTQGPRCYIRPRALHHRSEEHTSELQSPYDLVCRLLLEKKKKQEDSTRYDIMSRRHLHT